MALVPLPKPTSASATFPKGILVERLEAGSALVRVHRKALGPVWFGPKAGYPPTNRFDASSGQYQVCYAAAALDGAFVETLLRGRRRLITPADVSGYAFTDIYPVRDLTVAKLYDEGLLWHGTDSAVSSCSDYAEARRIAGDLHASAMEVDGIAYRSRHNNGELCYALFDRVKIGELTVGAVTLFEDRPGVVERLTTRHGVTFDTSTPVGFP